MKTATDPADFVRSAEYQRDRAEDYAIDAHTSSTRIVPGMKAGPASPHVVAVIDSATASADRADRAAEHAARVRDAGGTPSQIQTAQDAADRARAYARRAGASARAAVAAAFPDHHGPARRDDR